VNLFISVLFVFVLVDDNSTTKKRLTAIQIFAPIRIFFPERYVYNTHKTNARGEFKLLFTREA